MEERKMSDVKIEFRKASDYKMIPVTGAWGGVNPQAEIVFDLFVEKRETPPSVTMRIEMGKAPQEMPIEEGVIVREFQIGIVVRPDIAFSIGKWLIEKAREAGVVERSEGQA
jgi:hypothetical protein